MCHSNDAVDAQSAAGELADYFQTSKPGEQAARHDSSSPNVPHPHLYIATVLPPGESPDCRCDLIQLRRTTCDNIIPGADLSLAAWLPSASDIFQGLKALGYQQLPCPSGQPTAATEGQSEDPPAQGGSCRLLNVSLLLQTLESLLSETNAAGFFSDPVSVRR